MDVDVKESTVQATAAMELAAIPMFFIIGKGRSGTTLLQTLLDANPRVLIPLESRFVIHLKSKYEHVKSWNERKIMQFYDDLFTDIKFSMLWQVDKEKLKRDLLSLEGNITFTLLCKVVYLNYLSMFGSKSGIRLVGDKNPIHSIFTKELQRIFPGAKFIHLVRDYRDNIHSHMTVFPIKNVAFLARKWRFYNSEAEDLRRRSPGDVLTVRYEDLVSDPDEQLKKVCDFLGVEFTPAMMKFHQKINENYDRLGLYIDKYHSNLLNPVNRNKVNVWRTKMKPEHIHTADYIIGDFANQYGYYKEFTGGSAKLAMKKAFSDVKLYIWLFIVKGYYIAPLWLRSMVTSLFKLLFGKDYQKKKQLG